MPRRSAHRTWVGIAVVLCLAASTCPSLLASDLGSALLQLQWSSYLGGLNDDGAAGLAVDRDGNIFVVGNTSSPNFPPSATTRRGTDIFVSKFTKLGGLVSTWYLGGSADDCALGCVLDRQGNLLITGSTKSADFPTTKAYDRTYNGGGPSWGDVFVAKMSPSGKLLWSTYLGGSQEDYGWSIAADSFCNVYVTGMTKSSNFPTYKGYNRRYSGGTDAFVAKFISTGQLAWSTYHGGGGEDLGYGLVVDSAANVYVTGRTTSMDFPTVGAFDPFHSGGTYDGYVSKLNCIGALMWSTYIGGTGADCVEDVACDNAGNIWLVGETNSADLPTSGAWDPGYNGGGDGFIVEMTCNGTLRQCTYIGGQDYDGLRSIAVDSLKNVYITGYTSAGDFPIVGGGDPVYHGGTLDVTLLKLNSAGALVFSSLLGGNGRDEERAIAIGCPGSICVVGGTTSTNFPTLAGWDRTFNGGTWDAFVSSFKSSR